MRVKSNPIHATTYRFEGTGGFAVLMVAWKAHRDPSMGVFTNKDVTRIASDSEHLRSLPYDTAAKITREMSEIGSLEHVGGKRPKKYALTEVGAKALGRMIKWRAGVER